MNAINDYLSIQPEVADALNEGRAVVALESTIISHGMPYPRNIEMATRVEALVRDNGAVPATIAILDGRLQIGLDAAQIRSPIGRSFGPPRITTCASARDSTSNSASRAKCRTGQRLAGPYSAPGQSA